MLTIIICIVAIYLLYTLFNALFGSNTPRTPHNVSGSLAPSRRTNAPHETPFMAQQQSTHDNSHAAIAGLTGALAGTALAHHLDQNAQANAAAQQQLATNNNTSAANDANMSYDDFMNMDRTYDDNGNVIDYDDNNDLSDDDDNSDDYDSDDDSSSDDSSFFGGGNDGGDGGDWF